MLPTLNGKTQRLVSGFHMHGLVLTHFFYFFQSLPLALWLLVNHRVEQLQVWWWEQERNR